MKRFGIFVFFNEHGKVAPYVEVLLQGIREVLDSLLIVVNGNIREEERAKLDGHATRIFQRENIGYDGGAYKDVFTKLAGREEWGQWDEILLMNDSFYGPFYPWAEVFGRMEGCNADFWGLSAHPGGKVDMLGKAVPPHVQSYFILIKKEMYTAPAFWEFWEGLPYPGCYKEAVEGFEIRFSEYFTGAGFCYGTLLEVLARDRGMAGEPDIYDWEALVTDLRFPVLKRKAYSIRNYAGMKNIFRYVIKNTGYPLQVIESDIRGRCVDGKMKPYDPEKIKEFCKKYKEIYLFGAGSCAENIRQFLEDNGKRVCGYIVSDTRDDSRLLALKELELASDAGVIVALNEKNFAEVRGELEGRIPEGQMIAPVYRGE